MNVRIGWTIYAVALTSGVVVGEVLNLRQGPPSLVTAGNWLLTLALLTALWAYSLRRPLGTPWYWRAPCSGLCCSRMSSCWCRCCSWAARSRGFTAALTVLVLPAYYAAYRYAYRTPELWERAT
jgi:hypothetical protein